MRPLLIILFFLSLGELFAQKQSPELLIQSGHADEIISVDFSPDGKIMATGGEDHLVLLWDVATGKQMGEFLGHSDDVVSVRFHPNGKYLATVGEDAKMIIWDYKNGRKIKTLKVNRSPEGMEISDNGKYIVVGGLDGQIKIYNATTYVLMKSIQFPYGGILDFDLTSDSKYIFAASAGTKETPGAFRKISLSNFTTLKSISNWAIKDDITHFVTSIDIAPDGKTMLLDKGGYEVWDVATMTLLRRSELAGWEQRITADGKYISLEEGSDMVLYDYETFEEVKELDTRNGSIEDFFRGPKPNLMVTSTNRNGAILWDIETEREVRIFEGLSSMVSALDYHPTKHVLAAGTWTRDPIILDLKKGELRPLGNVHDGAVKSLQFSPDGMTLASGSLDESFAVTDWRSGEIIFKKEQEDDVWDLGFNPGGNLLVTIGQDDDPLPKVWDVATWEELRTFNGHEEEALFLQFVGDGNKVLSKTMNGSIKLWDAGTGKELRDIGNGSSREIATHKEKDLMALSFNYMVNVFRLGSLGAVKTLQTGDYMDAVHTLQFSKNGKYLVGGTSKGNIFIWNTSTWAHKKLTSAHADYIYALTFSNDGKYIISGSLDGRIKFWDLATGKYMGVLATFDNGDYILATSDNYYMATKGALQWVNFKVDGKVYPFEQFDLKYNRPDKVIEHFGYANPFLKKMYHLAYQKRLHKLGFTEDMLGSDFHIPEISITNSEHLPMSVTSEKVTLDLKASDSKYTLDRINIYVNGVPAYGTKGISLRGKNLKTHTENISLVLSQGMNVIEVSVLNSKGVESRKDLVEIDCIKPAFTKPSLYVLTIGVSNFKDSERNLQYAAKDARDIVTMYEESRNRQFANVHTKAILNEEATKENILQAKAFLNAAGVDDEVIIYVSSHGLLNDDLDYFLATYDVDFANPETNGLPYHELETMLASLESRNRLLMIDACHSGEVDKEEEVVREEIKNDDVTVTTRSGTKGIKPKAGLNNSFAYMQALFQDVSKGTGATVISAAGGYEFALESAEWDNGVFTYALLEGLKSEKADKNRDDVIRISELKAYVIDKVTELTGGAQVPTARKENLANDFIIYSE